MANDKLKYNFKPIPKQTPNIGIDSKNALVNLLANDEGVAETLDGSILNSFRNISDNRETLYTMYDSMSKDILISSALELYADDATEYNDNGDVIWAESNDDDIRNHVNYLLTSLKLDQYAWQHIHALVKYGDLYIETFRSSDLKEKTQGKDNLIQNTKRLNEENNKSDINKDKAVLTEDIIVNLYAENDRLQEYIETVANPAEIFDLTKRGKTAGFLKAEVTSKAANAQNTLFPYQYNYAYDSQDIKLYDPTKYIHIMLPDTSLRNPEEVRLFNVPAVADRVEYADKVQEATYTVKRGKSILYDLFKIYREISLLEDSILLNRVTRSALVRIIQVEVGDMGKPQVHQLLARVKSLFEQKSALNKDTQMTEYTNPGPVENNIYMPTRGGLGNITTNTLGGDFDVKSLTDLDYFNNKLFAGLKVPKQYLGFVDDNAGFSGGESLMRISSRYSKTIKRIKNAYIQGITTLINIFLLDKGLDSYVNRFTIKMTSPSTQEDSERAETLRTKVELTRDVMDLFADVEDNKTKLKLTKALLSDTITNEDFMNILNEYLEDNSNIPEEDNLDIDMPDEPTTNHSSGLDNIDADLDLDKIDNEQEDTLPSPDELDLDLTDNEEVSNELDNLDNNE